MPRFRFRGFPTSSAVALSVSQGAAAENSSVTSWGTQSPTSLDVSATFTESDDNGAVISPGAVWLTVTGWSGWDTPGPSGTEYDPRLHDIEYYWTITGPGDFAVRSEVNLPSSPAAFRDMSIQRGPKVVFPLSAAGSYTWTCFAVEHASGKSVTKTGSFTTTSEDLAYPGTRTICYSIDANFTGAPSGAVQVSNLAAAQAAITTAIAAGDTFRICFRRGETYAGSNIDFRSQWTSSYPNFRSSTYGTGADPIVTAPFAADNNGLLFSGPADAGSKHVFYGPMHWRGRWDTVNDRGHFDQGRPTRNNDIVGTITHYGFKITGVFNLGEINKQNDTHVAWIDCDLSGWKAYGNMSENGTDPAISLAYNRHFAYIGCRLGTVPNHVHQWVGREGSGEWSASLCNGGSAATGWIFRAIGHTHLVMQHCSTHSSFGVLAGSPASQRHFRLNNSDGDHPYPCPGMWVNVAYNVHEGTGSGGVWDLGGSIYYNAIFDGNLILPSGLSFRNEPIINIEKILGGLTVRNNYIYSGYSIEVKSTGTVMVGGGSVASGSTGPVSVYNNTAFNARNTASNYTRNLNLFSDSTVENNFFRRFGTDTGFDVAEQIAGLSLAFLGIRQGFKVAQHTLTETWANGGTFEMPYYNTALNEQDGTQTNQAYWQTLDADDNQHAILTPDGSIRAIDDDFSVAFTATGIEFTNNTRSPIGTNGTVLNIKMDRAGKLPAADGRYAPTSIGPIVWCRIADASKASFETTTGLISDRDLFGARRGTTPAFRGAVEV